MVEGSEVLRAYKKEAFHIAKKDYELHSGDKLKTYVANAPKLPNWNAKGLKKLADIVDLVDLPNTFNLGFGWVVIVPKSQVEAACAAGCGGVVIGELDSTGEVKVDWKFA